MVDLFVESPTPAIAEILKRVYMDFHEYFFGSIMVSIVIALLATVAADDPSYALPTLLGAMGSFGIWAGVKYLHAIMQRLPEK